MQVLSGDIYHIPESEYKNEASLQLMKLVVEKRRELDMGFIIIETAMYLLWAHLDYFALQAVPMTRPSTLPLNSSGMLTNRWSPFQARRGQGRSVGGAGGHCPHKQSRLPPVEI